MSGDNLNKPIDLSSLGVKELKKIITDNHLTYNDCIEIKDLRNRAYTALVQFNENVSIKENDNPINTNSNKKSDNSQKILFGNLNCQVIGSEYENPDLIMVMFHGFGATSEQFMILADVIHSQPLGEIKLCWVFPQAPDNAWWPLDISQWQKSFFQGEEALAKILREEPDGLENARDNSVLLINEVSKYFGISLDHIVIGGFSQGSMLAIDTALSLNSPPAGILAYSSFPIVVEQWVKKCSKFPGLDVLLTHGKSDQLLPYFASIWLKDLLIKGGLKVRFETHCGRHELGKQNILKATSLFLQDLVTNNKYTYDI